MAKWSLALERTYLHPYLKDISIQMITRSYRNHLNLHCNSPVYNYIYKPVFPWIENGSEMFMSVSRMSVVAWQFVGCSFCLFVYLSVVCWYVVGRLFASMYSWSAVCRQLVGWLFAGSQLVGCLSQCVSQCVKLLPLEAGCIQPNKVDLVYLVLSNLQLVYLQLV